MVIDARFALGLLLAATGCGSPRSSYLDTGGFYVTYTVIHDEGSETLALADFRDRGEDGSSLELVDGDRATVDDVLLLPKASEQQPESETAKDQTFSYLARVAPAPTHRFSLLREGEPKTVHVVTEVPAPGATIEGAKRATAEYPKPVLLTWTKVPGTKITISVTSDDAANCNSLVLEPDSEDQGFYVIDTKTLRVTDKSVGCSFAIRVTRRKESPIGEPFIGGVLRAISTSRVELELR